MLGLGPELLTRVPHLILGVVAAGRWRDREHRPQGDGERRRRNRSIYVQYPPVDGG